MDSDIRVQFALGIGSARASFSKKSVCDYHYFNNIVILIIGFSRRWDFQRAGEFLEESVCEFLLSIARRAATELADFYYCFIIY